MILRCWRPHQVGDVILPSCLSEMFSTVGPGEVARDDEELSELRKEQELHRAGGPWNSKHPFPKQNMEDGLAHVS